MNIWHNYVFVCSVSLLLLNADVLPDFFDEPFGTDVGKEIGYHARFSRETCPSKPVGMNWEQDFVREFLRCILQLSISIAAQCASAAPTRSSAF